MAQHVAANPPADTADLIANAVTSPETSLILRQILEAALANSPGASWAAQAHALLANILMNDYLNWWNKAGQAELQAAQTAAAQAGSLVLAQHAQGLIHRALARSAGGNALAEHKKARVLFRAAKRREDGFARAHAQFGNQKILLGRASEAHAPLDRARNLNPHHPASGYFDWAEGRAYFQEEIWSDAIVWLTKSVAALSTVWYNRCYLAAAQDAANQAAAAQQTMTDFLNDGRFDKTTFDRIVPSLQPNGQDPSTVARARRRVLAFVQKSLS
jgi:hypothetical protein